MINRPKPAVLITLSGWGIAPNTPGNAIFKANTPNFDKFIQQYPVMSLGASGKDVGLLDLEVGNSRVGHLNIGAGRIYKKILPRINDAIKSGKFFSNHAFLSAIEHTEKNNSSLHIITLFGNQIHNANDEHFFAFLQLAKQNNVKEVFVHAILDGEDDIYNNAIHHIKKIEDRMSEFGIGKIVSVSGRNYALDSGRNWDKIASAYYHMTAEKVLNIEKTALEAIQKYYDKEIYDADVPPTLIGSKNKINFIQKNDAVIFANFGARLARQLTKSFVLPAFPKFERTYLRNLFFVTMTDYEKEIPVAVAFPRNIIHNSLAEVLSKAEMRQIRIAETEKYSCVTSFFSGMFEDKFGDEEFVLIPSKKVLSYKEVPEMAANSIVKEVVKAIKSEKYDFILANFSNAESVSKTGDFQATLKACEIIDKNLGKIADYVLAEDGILFIVGDSGSAEEVLSMKTGTLDKQNSNNNVPFIIIQEKLFGISGNAGDSPDGDLSLLPKSGVLADVAPTILKALGIDKPEEMTGRSLI